MLDFSKYINSINDIQFLEQLIEKIKDDVINPSHDWQSRMILYQKVQIITKRIVYLKQNTIGK